LFLKFLGSATVLSPSSPTNGFRVPESK
jgi:hypothetical protein